MYRRKTQGWVKHLDFIIIDCLCLNIAFFFAYALRHKQFDLYQNIYYRNMAMIMTVFAVLVAIFFNSFKNILKRGAYKEFVATLKHAAILEAFIMVYLFSSQLGDVYSRITLYLQFPIYLFSSYILRLLWKKFVIANMAKTGNKTLLIIAADRNVDAVVSKMTSNNYGMFTLVGAVVLDNNRIGEKICDVPVVADYDSASEYVCRQWVDEVLIVLPHKMEYPQELVEDLQQMGVTVHITVSHMPMPEGKKNHLEQLGDYMVLTSSMNYASFGQIFIKRIVDILGSIIGCVVTILLTLIIGPIIFIKSPGPIFFKQTRVGYNGKKFKMYKFRSMYMDAEERKKELMEQNRVKDNLMFKMDFDPRIIGNRIDKNGKPRRGIGDFIRRTSIDEWPQMFNVLKGDMSLVGTRPPTEDEWEKYRLHHRARLAVRPGITGLWQVSGRSSITDFEKVVKLDTQYINEWNIGLDMKIMLKTVGVVLKKDGSM